MSPVPAKLHPVLVDSWERVPFAIFGWNNLYFGFLNNLIELGLNFYKEVVPKLFVYR